MGGDSQNGQAYTSGWINALLLCLFVLLTASLSLHTVVDNDVFQHIKTGEVIVRSHSIPRADIFSYTIAGKPWVNAQWLSDLVFYGLYHFFNVNGVILFTAVLMCLTYLLVLLTFYESNEMSWLFFLIATMAVIGSHARFINRPENFTLLFTAFYLHVLCRRRALLWTLPVVQIFWTNMHGGFIIGPVLAALSAEAPLFAAVFLACLANPAELKIFPYVFQFQNSEFLRSRISEWYSPLGNWESLATDQLIAALLLLFASVLALIASLWSMTVPGLSY